MKSVVKATGEGMDLLPTPWGHWVIVIFWCKKIIRHHKFEPLKYTTFDLEFGHRGTGRSSVPSQNCLVEPGFNNRWGIGTYMVTRVPDESMLRGLHHLALVGISLLENCYVQMYNLLECSPSIATSPDLTILQVVVNWRMPQLDECLATSSYTTSLFWLKSWLHLFGH